MTAQRPPADHLQRAVHGRHAGRLLPLRLGLGPVREEERPHGRGRHLLRVGVLWVSCTVEFNWMKTFPSIQ